jgi:DNA-binding cell septation regulator SpoVG
MASETKQSIKEEENHVTKISITNFQVVQGHPYVRAVAHLRMEGLHLRGLRLEESERGELTVGFPGRKIQGTWQVVYEPRNRATESQILDALKARYHAEPQVAA